MLSSHWERTRCHCRLFGSSYCWRQRREEKLTTVVSESRQTRTSTAAAGTTLRRDTANGRIEHRDGTEWGSLDGRVGFCNKRFSQFFIILVYQLCRQIFNLCTSNSGPKFKLFLGLLSSWFAAGDFLIIVCLVDGRRDGRDTINWPTPIIAATQRGA